MAFDTTLNGGRICAASVFRPGQLDTPLAKQTAGEPVRFGYKEVTKATGIKGLRYKDEATLMAVMAVHRLLETLGEEDQAIKDRTAVIVSSNYGNVDTVVEVAEQIAATSVDDTSAMALPNASSNSISATISILFQLRGVNLMLCNGDRGGEDGFELARQLIAAGRADRVMLVGVEVDNAVVRALFPTNRQRFHGAAAVLLAAEGAAPELVPGKAEAPIGRATIEARCGYASGAEGILRLALARDAFGSGEAVAVSMCGQTWELDG